MLKFNQHTVVLYSYRNSVFATIRRFGVSRATIYRWRKRYNGTTQSLVEYSRRPHSHPNQQTKLMQRGYKRSIPALWRILRKLSLLPVKPPNPNIFQSLTSLCFIPVKEFRLTWKSFPILYCPRCRRLAGTLLPIYGYWRILSFSFRYGF